MNDKFVDDLLDQAIPAVDPNAKKIAINSAVAEFTQGIDQTARPIDEGSKTLSTNHSSLWSKFMKLFNFNSPLAGKAFASLAVAFIAVSVVFIMPERNQPINEQFASKEVPTITPETPPTTLQRETSQATDSEMQDGKADLAITEIKQLDTFADADESAKVGNDSELGGIITQTSEDIVKSQPKEGFTAKPIELNTAHTRSKKPKDSLRLRETKQAPAENMSVDEMVFDDAEFTLEEVIVAGAPMVEPNEINRALNDSEAQQHLTSSAPSHQTGGIQNAAIGKPIGSAYIGSKNKFATQIRTDSRAGDLQSRPDLHEEYAKHTENTVKIVREEPVSTFSVDVDTASYSLVRDQLLRGYLPAVSAVRSEEMINYFNYDYPLPRSKKVPFKPSITVLNSPWNTHKKLVHIGIKGYDIANTDLPDSNLVFLLDVSGSMNSQNKLPLVKQSINLLLETLKPTDTVSIVVYAGAAGTVLEPTKVKEKNKITEALRNLNAGGSTAGGEGIALAYQLAEQNFDKNAVNRIILATDGDFNVGLQSNEDLKTLVERKRDKGVLLSVLGFGRNNYQDDMMQTLAQNGNGVAAYIDSLSEAKKVLLDEATSTLFTIAKDVKIQVEFNAATVSEYRLIGYETRNLKRDDFNNDKVDAGDIGAGHTVTAIYEITPVGAQQQSIDQLRYNENKQEKTDEVSDSNEYGFIKIRYKLPNEKKSKLIEQAINKSPSNIRLTEASQDVQFSVAVAGFAQLLKGGKNTRDLSFDEIITLARQNKGKDPFGYRSEFINLVGMAKIAKP